MSGEHLTKQGRSILDCLEENEDRHLTAEELSELLKAKNEPVSTATIYRQLEKLTVHGFIRKYVSSPDEPACYQFHGKEKECASHFHLKCTVCNTLFHVSCPHLSEIEHHVFEHHGFLVDNTRTVLYGVCENCRKAAGIQHDEE